jgi:uncharacterized lipoprotein
MKTLLYLILIALFVGGCSYKNEAINLHSYKAEYSGPISKDMKSVYLKVVKDDRLDKRSIGRNEKNAVILARFYSEVNFADKYKEGLGYALNIAGFKTDIRNNTAAMQLEVYIKNIELVYNNKKFDTNLEGIIEIEVIIKKGDTVLTQNFRQKGSKWIRPSFESKDLEPFLYTLFEDSINDIVARLTKY